MTRRTISVLPVSKYLGFLPHLCEFLVRDTSGGTCHLVLGIVDPAAYPKMGFAS